jgi:hypothetical protein
MNRELLKQALGAIKAAQRSYIDFDYRPHPNYMLDTIGKLEAELAKPEQDINIGTDLTVDGMHLIIRRGDVIVHSQFYKSPPRKEWKGLTHDEQHQIAIECGAMSSDWLDLVVAVEKRLKEKNE